MPIVTNKRLHVGKSYRIEFVSDGATPDVSFLMRGWVPRSGVPAPPGPLTLEVAPGGSDDDTGTVPASLALDLEWDVPEDPSSKVIIRVIEDGQNVLDHPATRDGFLTIVVRK